MLVVQRTQRGVAVTMNDEQNPFALSLSTGEQRIMNYEEILPIKISRN